MARGGRGRRGRRGSRLDGLRRSGGFLGVGAMACLAFLYLGSASALPTTWVVALVAAWVVLVATTCAWFTRHPLLALLPPIAGLALWLTAVLTSRAGG